MHLQNFFTSQYGIRLTMKLSRTLPKSAAFAFIRFIARVLVKFEHTDLLRAIKTNQWVAQGKSQSSREALNDLAYQVIAHAGRCYYDFYRTINNPEAVLELVPPRKETNRFIQEINACPGAFIVGPHLSNFDLALRAMSIQGLQSKILAYETPTSGYKLQNRIRHSVGLEVIPLGAPNVFNLAVHHLKEGGTVSTGVDRPVAGKRKKRHQVEFFGQPSNLPVGYIQIALAADVPVFVIGTQFNPDTGTYQIINEGPIPLLRRNNRLEEIRENANRILKVIENMIRECPEQWLMYYPVWPDLLDQIP
jgi:KDO2-lipid IV(A) lauroyltransferase